MRMNILNLPFDPQVKNLVLHELYGRPYGVFTKIYGCHLVIKLLNLFIPSKVFLRKTVCIVFKVHVGHSSKR